MASRVKLAVYGTLKSTNRNHSLLGPDVEIIARNVRIPGFTMYDLGHFPGVVRDPEGLGVEVEVVSVPTKVLHHIDLYEGYDADNPGGSLFEREAITLDNGDAVLIYLYACPVDANRTPVIPSGNWDSRKAA